MDLMGKARGRVMGRGISGQRRQGPGTMTPCALAIVANPEEIETRSNSRISLVRIKVSNNWTFSLWLVVRTKRVEASCTFGLSASLECAELVQRAQSLIKNRHSRSHHRDDKPAHSQRKLRAELIG